MLIDKITNPWIRFKLVGKTLEGEEKSRLAKDVFLYVIRSYNAYESQKNKMLDEIADIYPDIDDAVSDEEILDVFVSFCDESIRRGKVVTTAELGWARKFVREPGLCRAIERNIYKILLMASSHWDSLRKGFDWTIPESEKEQVAISVLLIEEIGSKRKMELAEEFGQSKKEFVRVYFRKLLYDRHYDQAKALGVDLPDTVLEVIVDNLNNGYMEDAYNLARLFLPDRDDLRKEVRQIADAF